MKIGDSVKVTKRATIYTSGTGSATQGHHDQGATGKIVDGPSGSRWKVRFTRAPQGWCEQKYLYVTTVNPPPPPPVGAHLVDNRGAYLVDNNGALLW